MAKKTLILAALFLFFYCSIVTAAEELRLTTVLPTASVLRGTRGAIGPNYMNPGNLSNDAIENGHLYIERGLDIGTFYDGADPVHGAYVNSHVLPGMIRLGEWTNGYSGGTLNGITAGMALGVAHIHSFEKLYFAISHNLAWSDQVRRIADGPGTFLLLGRNPITNDPGLLFQLVPSGPGGTVIDELLTSLWIKQKRVDIRTFRASTSASGAADGLYINSFPAVYYSTDGSNKRIWYRSTTGDNMIAVWPVSDISLKKEIVPIPDALGRLGSIRGVNFKWKTGEDTSLQTGVIAQEVEKAFPELVKTDEKGLKSVRYDEFAGILIEAVKSLKKEGEELDKEYKALEERVSRLEKKI